MKKLAEILMISLIALSYFSYESKRGLNINLGYYFPFIAGAIVIFLALIIYIQNRRKFESNQVKGFLLLLIPEIIVIVYTFFVWIFSGYTISYVSRGFSNILLYVLPIVQAFFVIYIFKDKGADIVFKGTVLNYTIILLIYIIQNGVFSLFNTIYLSIFDNTGVKTILEAHQVTFVLGLFLVYYIMNKPKDNKLKIIISIIYLILGLKRILIGGIVVALVIAFILNKIKNLQIMSKIVTIMGILSILLCYGWVYSIKSGALEEFSNRESINFMTRFKLFNGVSTLYELKPSYLGKGIGYVSKWREEQLSQTIGLHSDLLKKYIEYGFVMYGFYMWYKLYYTPKKIFKYINKQGMITYIALILLTIICWTTDNVAGYYMYILGFSVIVMQMFILKEKKNEEEINEKDSNINTI